MLLPMTETRHIQTLVHEGKMLIVATVWSGRSCELHYTVKQDGFEDSALRPDSIGWESFRKLDFFNQVVDPEWLASNDEEARALRQTQMAAPNEVWRVLHRVTYVERPALMGFGRDVRALTARAEEDQTFTTLMELRQANKKLEEKMDSILRILTRNS